MRPAPLALLSACGLRTGDLPRLDGGDIAILATIVGVISLAASWSFISRRRSSIDYPMPTPPARRPVAIAFSDPGEHNVRLRAPGGAIELVPAASVPFALQDGYTRIPKVHMRAPDGVHVLVDEDEVPLARSRGYWPMTPSEIAAAGVE